MKNKKKILIIFIIIGIILFSIFFYKLYLNAKNDILEDVVDKDKSESEKASKQFKNYISKINNDGKVIFTMKTTGSYEADEWNFYIEGAQMFQIDVEYDESCSGMERINGECNSDTKYTIKGLIPGTATIWITTAPDFGYADNSNTAVYNLIIDDDLNVQAKSIEFIEYYN